MKMNSLLKLEFRRLKSQRSFYICICIMVALLLLSTSIKGIVVSSVPDLVKLFSGYGMYSLLNAASECSFDLLICIFTVLFVCDDYEQHIVKIIYAKGYSRKNVYIAKLISVWVAATLMFFVAELAAFIFTLLYLDLGNMDWLQCFSYMGAQYIMIMASVAFYYAIASVLRKTGASIAAGILIPIVVSLVLGLLDSLALFGSTSLLEFWIASFPTGVSVLLVSSERLLWCLLGSGIYFGIFLIAGQRLNNRIDL